MPNNIQFETTVFKIGIKDFLGRNKKQVFKGSMHEITMYEMSIAANNY